MGSVASNTLLQKHTKHQGSVCGTGDEDGLILDTTGVVAGTEDWALHYKVPGEVLGLNLQSSGWGKHTDLDFKSLRRLK